MKISKKIIKNLKMGGVNFYLSVPCKLLANMIEILEKDKSIYYSSVPREEEGMGICAGAYLGRKLPCIMMQNTGLGNSVNAIVSLLQLYNLPVIFLISYRGTPGEQVSAQGGMAKITKEILDTLKIPTLHCSTEKDLDNIKTYTDHAKIMESPVAILCDFQLMKDDK
tara:strand:+ start:1892 stop:2392 length:501 start_codon:yes stop_codon:yes gene_type:complete